MSDSSDLLWFRRHLVSREAGLLTEEEDARFERLLSESARCRSLFERFRIGAPSLPESAEHISAYKLARWDRMVNSLRGIERRLVREHLERCETCRQDLEALGFRPVMDEVPDLESGTASPPPGATGDPSTSQVIPIDTARRRERPGGRDTRAVWAAGGWLVAAAACAALFLATNRGGDDMPGLRSLRVVPIANTVRGGDASGPVIPVAEGGREIAVVVASSVGYAMDAEVRVRLLDRSGRKLFAQEAPFRDISYPHVLVMTSPRPLRSGRYVLRIEPVTPGVSAEAQEFPFEISREEGDRVAQ